VSTQEKETAWPIQARTRKGQVYLSYDNDTKPATPHGKYHRVREVLQLVCTRNVQRVKNLVEGLYREYVGATAYSLDTLTQQLQEELSAWGSKRNPNM
jgi:hypothetical protein